MKELVLSNQFLDSLDLSYFKTFIQGIAATEFEKPSGREIYRLLFFLSQNINDSLIIDLGTFGGASALILASNSTNRVISIDRKNIVHSLLEQTGKKPLMVYSAFIDFIVTEDFFRYSDFLLTSKILYVDISHTGEPESNLFDFLIKNNYKGFVIFDDINHSDFPGMKDFWNNIQVPKMDLTKYGHWTGTGAVDFGKNFLFKMI